MSASADASTPHKFYLTTYFLLLLSIFVRISSSSSSGGGDNCVSSTKEHLALVAIHEPASLLQIYDGADNVAECANRCCLGPTTSAGKECNAVSFYESGSRFLCVLLSCQPFDKCTWKATAQNFVAVYIKPSKTSAKTTTTTTTTVVTTTTRPTTTAYTFITTPVEVRGEDFLPQWNIMQDEAETTKGTTTPPTTATHLKLPLTSTVPLGDLNPHTTNQMPTPIVVQSAQDTQPTFWVMKNIYALIGLTCLLCFLVLMLAIAMKKYQDKLQGKPQYRQLRDYDVRVEPPASGASLLAA